MQCKNKSTGRFFATVFVAAGLSLAAAFPAASHGAERVEDGSDSAAAPAIHERYREGMHVILTGVGPRFYVREEAGASVLVIVDGEALQFDIGPLTVHNIAKAGVHPKAVDHLFITHLHMDHISAFPQFMSTNKMMGGDLRVYGPKGVKAMAEGANAFLKFDIDFLSRLWRMRFDYPVTEITEGGVVLETDKVKVTAAQTAHMDIPGPYSFAYRVDSKYGSVVISGDTTPSLNVVELAKGADILIHEAAFDHDMLPEQTFSEEVLAGISERGRELALAPPVKLADGVRDEAFGHSEVSEVAKVATAADAGKLVLYHRSFFAATQAEFDLAVGLYGFSREMTDHAMLTEMLAAAKRHFDGPVYMGEPLMVFRVGADE